MNQRTDAREVRLIAISAAKGIRLPRALLRQYGWSDSIMLEELEDGVFLRGKKPGELSWKETYRAMAASQEDWSEFDSAVADGVD